MTTMSPTEQRLLATCEEAVARCLSAGATGAEAFASHVDEAEVGIQHDDLHTASTAEETTIGLRVWVGRSTGFLTTNTTEGLGALAEEACALARGAPGDDLDGPPQVDDFPLAAPFPVDERLTELEVVDLVTLAKTLIANARRDRRISIDSGAVQRSTEVRAIVTSAGTRFSDRTVEAGASLFGMAVDGDDVGSFDHESHAVRDWDQMVPELEAMAQRFAVKTLGALGATKGESFRGPIVLSPEAVLDFILGDLASVLSAKAVRTGRSPLGHRLGSAIASPSFHLEDQPHLPGAVGSARFDREGIATRPIVLVRDGVLASFFYDVREARAAGKAPSGHARGGAASAPMIGSSNLVLRAGDTPFAALCAAAPRTIVVSRFSGSTEPTTGEFSGVVKGGFLVQRGERRPIKETLIAGNLYDLLQRISGISREVRNIGGSDRIPGLRMEDVSITAG